MRPNLRTPESDTNCGLARGARKYNPVLVINIIIQYIFVRTRRYTYNTIFYRCTLIITRLLGEGLLSSNIFNRVGGILFSL